MTTLIDHNRRLVFIHVPKTGGTTVTALLTGQVDTTVPRLALYWRPADTTGVELLEYQPRVAAGGGWRGSLGHVPAATVRSVYGRRLDAYMWLGFVRNPWDRFVSVYFHDGDMRFRSRAGRRYDLDGYAAELEQRIGTGVYRTDDFCRPQWTWLDGCGPYGKVCRYERLLSDLRGTVQDVESCSNVWLRQAPRARDWRVYYSSRTAEVVGRLYREDIRRWSYSFDPPRQLGACSERVSS